MTRNLFNVESSIIYSSKILPAYLKEQRLYSTKLDQCSICTPPVRCCKSNWLFSPCRTNCNPAQTLFPLFFFYATANPRPRKKKKTTKLSIFFGTPCIVHLSQEIFYTTLLTDWIMRVLLKLIPKFNMGVIYSTSPRDQEKTLEKLHNIFLHYKCKLYFLQIRLKSCFSEPN